MKDKELERVIRKRWRTGNGTGTERTHRDHTFLFKRHSENTFRLEMRGADE